MHDAKLNLNEEPHLKTNIAKVSVRLHYLKQYTLFKFVVVVVYHIGGPPYLRQYYHAAASSCSASILA